MSSFYFTAPMPPLSAHSAPFNLPAQHHPVYQHLPTTAPTTMPSPAMTPNRETMQESPLIKTFRTIRGRVGILFEKNEYHAHNHYKDSMSWVCKHKGCKATVKTSKEYLFISKKGAHDHTSHTATTPATSQPPIATAA